MTRVLGSDIHLTRPECLQLLATASIGRVGLSVDSLPMIQPVNIALDSGLVVFRTGGGAKLRAAVDEAVVCIAVDEIDAEWRSGWSVVVTGTARLIPVDEVSAAVRSTLVPWSLEAKNHYVGVDLDLVTGRRVGPVLWT